MKKTYLLIMAALLAVASLGHASLTGSESARIIKRPPFNEDGPGGEKRKKPAPYNGDGPSAPRPIGGGK